MASTRKKSFLLPLIFLSLINAFFGVILIDNFVFPPHTQGQVNSYNETRIYENGLIIENNEQVVIENCDCEINGKLVLRDNSTLILKDTKIQLIESGNKSIDNLYWFNISGNARLLAINVTIETIFFQNFGIIISDNASALFDTVYSLEWYSLICEDASKIEILNSTCWSMIKSYDNSYLTIEDSSIYGTQVKGNSKANLRNVKSTQLSIDDHGFLEIYDSTISSETDGVKLRFDDNAKLTLNNFSTRKSGFDYQLCENWSLFKDNIVTNSSINIKLTDVYLKNIFFILPPNSDIDVKNLNNSIVNIDAQQEKLLIRNSKLNEIKLMNNSFLDASSVELKNLIASQSAKAIFNYSVINHISCYNKSKLILSSSKIKSIDNTDYSLLLLEGSDISEDIKILENSIILNSSDLISFSNITYHKGNLNLSINQPVVELKIIMIINKNRIRDEEKIQIYINEEKKDLNIDDENELKFITFNSPPGDNELSIYLGPKPPEHVPFYLTQVGQKLISFFIILILILAVLLAWR